MHGGLPVRFKGDNEFRKFSVPLVDNVNYAFLWEDDGEIKLVDAEAVVEKYYAILWDIEVHGGENDQVLRSAGGVRAHQTGLLETVAEIYVEGGGGLDWVSVLGWVWICSVHC